MSSADQLLDALRAIAPVSGRMQPASLVKRASARTGWSRIEVHVALRALKQRGSISGQLDAAGVPLGMITLVDRVAPMTDSERTWRETLACLANDDIEALAGLHGHVGHWSQADRRQLVESLCRLRDAQSGLGHLPRYVISARYLMGSSKLLDILPQRSLQQFGLTDVFESPPLPVLVAGDAQPATVVLVENPQAFSFASQVTAGLPIAWIATYGYGLSMIGDAAGGRLVRALSSGQARSIVAGGTPPALEVLLQHPNMTYWGDLDPEGMRIYERLRSQLPWLALSALYTPMIELMQTTGGHPLEKATGKDGQQPDTVHPFSAMHCPDRGLDQEAICDDPELIRAFAQGHL